MQREEMKIQKKQIGKERKDAEKQRQFDLKKSQPSFTSDDSLRRMLYLASQRITKRWRTRCQNRDLVLSPTPVPFHR